MAHEEDCYICSQNSINVSYPMLIPNKFFFFELLPESSYHTHHVAYLCGRRLSPCSVRGPLAFDNVPRFRGPGRFLFQLLLLAIDNHVYLGI